MVSPTPNYAGGRHAPGLRIGSHNIDGLRTALETNRGKPNQFHGISKLNALLHNWHCLCLHVICVQETHLQDSDIDNIYLIEQRLAATQENWGLPRFQAFWGCNTTASRAGVAILIRSDMLGDGRIKLQGSPHTESDGRLMHIRLTWGGHTIRIVNAYFPSSDPSGQKNFVTNRLQPLLQTFRGREQVMIAGDFNFTTDWRIDRARAAAPHPPTQLTTPPPPLPTPPPPPAPTRHRDEGPAQTMATLCATHNLHDAYRSLHPTRPSFTYLSGNWASRLDRIYTTAGLLPHVHQCAPGRDVASPSDHLPLILHLRPRQPPARKATRPTPSPRIRMDFWSSTTLATHFTTWLQSQIQTAPLLDDSDLLTWWPTFKASMASTIRALNRDLQTQRFATPMPQQQAQSSLDAAYGRLEASTVAQVIPEILTAHRQLRSALTASALTAEQTARHEWLRDGERPGPLLGKLMTPPAGSSHIAALKCVSGGLVVEGQQMAEMMATFFASVSSPRPRCPEAEAQVLNAVQIHATKISPAMASSIGNPIVTTAEVLAAISSSHPGKSPGPDGLPTQLWRRTKAHIAPVLAAVYSAIGRSETVPFGFLLGELHPIHKGGDPTACALHRPITLLNTDYRLLAKVLATRLAPVLAACVGPEQTAFLPGRLMGDNITFMQLIPLLLKSNAKQRLAALDSSAVVAFLDFTKAYDTVLRPFLYSVMEATGAGQGLIRWAMTLLSDTRTAARVNGHLSSARLYEAGLRQGSPLAPILYLFIAWALSCWLRDCPALGIKVTPGPPCHCIQYADDVWAFLRDMTIPTITCFLNAMTTFADASNQHLNHAKSVLLPVGATGPATKEVCGIKVVNAATSLGVTYTNGTDPPPAVPWEDLLDTVRKCYTKLAKLPLSMWGRATAASSYGLSKLLFQAEFYDSIPDSIASQLHSWSTALVDRQEPPPLPPPLRRLDPPNFPAPSPPHSPWPPSPPLLSPPLLPSPPRHPPPSKWPPRRLLLPPTLNRPQ